MNQLIRLARRMDLSFVPRWMRRVAAAPGSRRRSRPEPPDAADSALTGFSPSQIELQRIETRAERAIVQELRLYERTVRKMVPELQGDDLAYASGLLLKLDRKAREQLTDTTAPRSVQLLPQDVATPDR